jgi:hypothetical protein
MNGTIVIVASPDRREVTRLCNLLNHRGISATIETRTVYVGGKAANGYRLRVPAELMIEAQTALAQESGVSSKMLEKNIEHLAER